MSFMHKKIGKNDFIYKPINKEKYVGKEGYCVCRSSWEIIFCRWADHNPMVVEWASEPLSILYVDKTQKDYRGMPKKRRYFPDFLCKILDKNGNINTWLVEIKPYKETIPPKNSKGKSKKTKVYEAKTYAVNQAKWASAERFCRKRGWHFKILTEKQLLR
jgi:hypothetical protein